MPGASPSCGTGLSDVRNEGCAAPYDWMLFRCRSADSYAARARCRLELISRSVSSMTMPYVTRSSCATDAR